MIVRLVKMTFEHDRCDDFEKIFFESRDLIQNMPGCHHVELLKQTDQIPVYFTRSLWESESDLNFYRNSELFSGVWKATKALFADKPEAWSTEVQEL